MRPFRPGLCSVTCRALPLEQVVDLAASAGVEAIEWGGDVHVPHGDLAAAELAVVRSAAAGLEVVSYGSYLFLDGDVERHLGAVLDTAAVLRAPGVRVWCPFGIEPGAPSSERAAVVRAAATAAAAAEERGLHLTLEFHGGTLTADAASTRSLLDEVGSAALLSAWQPPYWAPRAAEEEAADIGLLTPALAHVHVYDWSPDLTRHPLRDDDERWVARLAAAAGAGSGATDVGAPRSALVEFVPGDEPDAVAGQVAVLRGWLDRLDDGSGRLSR